MRRIPIVACDKSGKIVREYMSLTDAAKDGYIHPAISNCLNGKRKSHGGLSWRPMSAGTLLDRYLESGGDWGPLDELRQSVCRWAGIETINPDDFADAHNRYRFENWLARKKHCNN